MSWLARMLRINQGFQLFILGHVLFGPHSPPMLIQSQEDKANGALLLHSGLPLTIRKQVEGLHL